MEEREYKGFVIKISQDNDPCDPLEQYDHLGKMVCFHGRYKLGHEHQYQYPEEFKRFLEEEGIETGEIIALPLFLYDHGGITMNTTGFSCPWDSGQVGVIYAKQSEAKEWFQTENPDHEKVVEVLKDQVKNYDYYLTGQVYGYTVENQKGEVIDSCWGFYGDPEESGLLEEAENAIDYELSKNFPLFDDVENYKKAVS